MPEALTLPRRLARALLHALLHARLPHARDRVRADGRIGREGLRGRRHARRACARSPTRSARRPRRAARPRRRRRRHARRRSAAWSCRTGAENGAVPAVRHCHARERRPGSTAIETLAMLKPVLEDAAIAKVGHDLKFAAGDSGAPRHHAGRPRPRHDAGRPTCSTRRDRARTWSRSRSSSSATRR